MGSPEVDAGVGRAQAQWGTGAVALRGRCLFSVNSWLPFLLEEITSRSISLKIILISSRVRPPGAESH